MFKAKEWEVIGLIPANLGYQPLILMDHIPLQVCIATYNVHVHVYIQCTMYSIYMYSTYCEHMRRESAERPSVVASDGLSRVEAP